MNSRRKTRTNPQIQKMMWKVSLYFVYYLERSLFIDFIEHFETITQSIQVRYTVVIQVLHASRFVYVADLLHLSKRYLNVFSMKWTFCGIILEYQIKELLHKLPRLDKIFEVHRKIGEGTFSSVYLGSLRQHAALSDDEKRWFAIKHLVPTAHPARIEHELRCLQDMGCVFNCFVYYQCWVP